MGPSVRSSSSVLLDLKRLSAGRGRGGRLLSGRLLEDDVVLAPVGDDAIARGEGPFEDPARERVQNEPLQGSLERARSVVRVESGLSQVRPETRRDLQGHLAISE